MTRPRSGLIVYTTRLARGVTAPNLLDVTRASAERSGEPGPFAPSWPLLMQARTVLRQADALAGSDPGAAEALRASAWAEYEPRYVAEMRESYREHRAAWATLLALETVVLACVCPSRERCHRGILAGTILPAFGAFDGGELTAGMLERWTAEPEPRRGAFGR